jgi:hypothetical protein
LKYWSDGHEWCQNDRKNTFTDLQSTSDVLGTFSFKPIPRKIEAGHRPTGVIAVVAGAIGNVAGILDVVTGVIGVVAGIINNVAGVVKFVVVMSAYAVGDIGGW